MKNMKKLLCFLLCAVMLMSLTACGTQDAAVGNYTGVAVTGENAALALIDIYPAGLTLSLRSNGRVAMISGDQKGQGTWERAQDGSITLAFEGSTCNATLNNDMLSLVSPEQEDLTFLLRRDDGTDFTIPLTAQTLEEAIGDTQGTEDFLSPTKKLYVGMQLYGSMRFSDITQADGTKDPGEMYMDVWGIIDKDANGNSFFEVFTTEEHADTNPVLSLYIKLAPNLIAPVIGENDSWLGSMYLTQEHAKCFAVRLKNGAMNFTMPYTDLSGYSCTIDLILREKGAPWDLHGDRFVPTGITAADIENALNTK